MRGKTVATTVGRLNLHAVKVCTASYTSVVLFVIRCNVFKSQCISIRGVKLWNAVSVELQCEHGPVQIKI